MKFEARIDKEDDNGFIKAIFLEVQSLARCQSFLLSRVPQCYTLQPLKATYEYYTRTTGMQCSNYCYITVQNEKGRRGAGTVRAQELAVSKKKVYYYP